MAAKAGYRKAGFQGVRQSPMSGGLESLESVDYLYLYDNDLLCSDVVSEFRARVDVGEKSIVEDNGSDCP